MVSPPRDFESRASTNSAIPARRAAEAGLSLKSRKPGKRGTIALFAVRLADFDFDLPSELIAQQPAPTRSASRLMVVPRAPAAFVHTQFNRIGDYLREGDLLVVNDTRVIKARLSGRKASGGKIEVMVERVLDAHTVLAMIRASHAPAPGSVIAIDEQVSVEVLGREDEFYRLRFIDMTVEAALEAHGELPLPPYITHRAEASDAERYQTVYARAPGAVAAPTAGLHFDAALLAQLEKQGVGIAQLTLHVGAGTFTPVRAERIEDHRMHSEWYEIPPATLAAMRAAKARGARVIAVGTTSLRAIEAAAATDFATSVGETRIFITPGYAFRMVDMLVTNFHLPKSTLLMLVSAFCGHQRILSAYAEAIEKRYRFFSYGDAMLLERAA